MDVAGPLIFVAIAILICAAGFFISRRFRAATRRPLPGSRESGAGAVWLTPPDDGSGDAG
ncbi:hypothetical protein [Oricola sp.]|uniref:hypothetical protein n=1 Tax=Oricola sp. TaxID=1979950 RepID=UPI0025D27418|nr:hypothetical protein [Oricola sp.]MCI5074627.1 hypothetical protein [Oricola sp.]